MLLALGNRQPRKRGRALWVARPTPYRLPKLPPWTKNNVRDVLPRLVEGLHSRRELDWTDFGPSSRQLGLRPESFLLRCPRCQHHLEAAKRILYTRHKWRPLYCKGCERFTSSWKWRCQCEMPWPQCQHHRKPGFSCGPRTLQKTAGERGAAALLPRSRKTAKVAPLGQAAALQWATSSSQSPLEARHSAQLRLRLWKPPSSKPRRRPGPPVRHTEAASATASSSEACACTCSPHVQSDSRILLSRKPVFKLGPSLAKRFKHSPV
jgi:hypothetical protein